MATKKEIESALNVIKQKNKFFYIAINVEDGQWQISFSDNLTNGEVLEGLTYCAYRVIAKFSDDDYRVWLHELLSMFLENAISDQSIDLNTKDVFILFTVDFEQRFCNLLSKSATNSDMTKILYWALQSNLSQWPANEQKVVLNSFFQEVDSLYRNYSNYA